ncbi:hypothetical protein FVA81_20580 [Rhizobium sp. WL3]|uniref:hypothetical protein n=1 Tax=Rhizobium sp. WL3 TaxID=2603277 RepID=UPI0011C1EA5A|nr:hypothetical protein [Rhizobium sp. WL3]QEE46854.1 hypothetical protein FVA81_20580 [Rhizobium sp. WL3]
MLRLFGVALSLLFIVSPSSAEILASGQAPYLLINDANGVMSETQKTPRQTQRVPPQRYICVVYHSGGIGQKGQTQCPAKPGRVGGRCRCANVTGSGTLYTY